MATYYVNNLTGSDSNNGLSEAAPFLTLNKLNALAGLLANDIVRVKATGTDYAITYNGTNTTIDFFRDSTPASRNIFLTNWLSDGDTRPKIVSFKSLVNTASVWNFNCGLKNIDLEIDDLTVGSANWNLAIGTGTSLIATARNCKINYLRTGGSLSVFKTVTASFFQNAYNLDINFNGGQGSLQMAGLATFYGSIIRNIYNSSSNTVLISFAASTIVSKNIFQNVLAAFSSASYIFTANSSSGTFCNNTVIVSDVILNANDCRMFSSSGNFNKTFSNIFINNRSSGACYFHLIVTATYPTTLAMGNNAFRNFTAINKTETLTDYPTYDDLFLFGGNITLAASPFITETYGASGYLQLDDTTASGLACIGAAFYDTNADIGCYQSSGGGAGGETDPNKVLNTSTIITGNYIPVTAANVRAGTTFGLSETGLLNLPAEADVKLSVSYDNATKTGTLESTDPGEANVVSGTTYKINSVLKTGTRTSIYALLSAAIVKIGEDIGNGTFGTYDGSDRYSDPLEANVLNGVSYKFNSLTNNKTGTLLNYPLLAVNLVKIGTDRGDGATGTYDGAERYSDLDLSQIVSGYAYRYNSLTDNRTGTRTSIYPVLAANLVKIGTDRGDTVTGTYDASERYTDITLSNVVNDYSFRYNSLIDNRTGTRSAKYPLLPVNEVKYDIDRGDGELGSYRALELYTELSQNDVKDGVEYRYNSLTNNKTGNYLAYPLLALDFVKIGVNRGDGQFGTYTAIERYTDLPENEVKLGTVYLYNNVEKTGTLAGGAADYPLESKVLYPTAYAFGTKIGTLGTYNTSNLNIAEQINNNAKIVISNVLGAEWQELKYFKDIAKNDFYSNANKFGIRPLNDLKTNDVIGKETLDLEFEIKLTTDFVNQDGDDLERIKELYLIEKMEAVRRQLRMTKFGNFNAIRIVKEYSREEVEKLQNADVLVCRAIITVSYGIN